MAVRKKKTVAYVADKPKYKTNLQRKHGEYSSIEKKLVKEISELTELIFFGVDKVKAWEYYANWEPSALLSYDRNNLIRLGILIKSACVESWVNWIVIKYFLDEDKYYYRHKKYKLFEKKILSKLNLATKIELVFKIYKVPTDIKLTLNELRKIRNCMAHEQFLGIDSDEKLLYGRKSVLDLKTFKVFLNDLNKADDYLSQKCYPPLGRKNG